MRLDDEEIPYRRKAHRAALTTDWGSRAATAAKDAEESSSPASVQVAHSGAVAEVAARACGLVYRHPYYLTPVSVAVLQRSRTAVPAACLVNGFREEPPRAVSERQRRAKRRK